VADATKEHPMSETPNRPARLVGGALLLAAIVAAPLALAAGGGWRDGWHGGCDRSSPQSAAELRDRMDGPAERFADRVDATDAQRAEIDAALDTLAPRLWTLKDRHEALRGDAQAAFAEEELDRAELDELRREGLALADEASVAALDAVWRVADALSVEQRRELVDAWEAWHR
jgi:hypothetical protein